MNDQQGMRLALAEAERAALAGEVPVGAVVIRGEEVVGRGHNRREIDADPLAHAEFLAIRQASDEVGWLEADGMHALRDPGAVRDVRRCVGQQPN